MRKSGGGAREAQTRRVAGTAGTGTTDVKNVADAGMATDRHNGHGEKRGSPAAGATA